MKTIKRVVSLLLACCMLLGTLALTSCGGVKNITVVFYVEGDEYHRCGFDGTSALMFPNDPKKEGYTFKGWFWDEGIWQKPFTMSSLADVPLTSDIPAYAYFQDNNGPTEADTFHLSFNTMGGSRLETQTVKSGAKPTQPTIPTMSGYYFCGWYTYPDYQTLFSFDQPLTADTTVYAKWAQIGSTQLVINDFEDIVQVEQDLSFYDMFREKETGRTFVVYKLGTMRNVIMGRVTNQSLLNTGGGVLEWGKSYGWEESISESFEQSLSTAITVSLEVESGVEVYGASTSVTLGLSTTLEVSESYGYATTRSVMEDASQGGSVSLDGYERNRYYDMFAVGDQTVYQYFVFDANGKLETSAITASEISSGRMLLSSERATFSYENIPILNALEAPDFSMIFASGAGTKSSPYYIDSPEQLFAVGLCPTANYKLASDIDLSKFKDWRPIGVSESIPFSGTFDGCGKTIKNLQISYNYEALEITSDQVYGLFGHVSGEVKNLNLNNMSLEFSPCHKGNGWIWGSILCGKISGNVSNIKAKECHVTVHRDRSSNGIIAARVSGTVNNVEVMQSSVYSNGDGGLVAGAMFQGNSYDNKVSGCELKYYAVYENRCFGGIAGYISNSVVKNCSVDSSTFILAGSGDDMHTYNIFGGHHYCKLRPSMGYIIGTSASSTLNPDSHKAFNNTIVLQSDKDFVGNTKAAESQHWFRFNGGKFGSVK